MNKAIIQTIINKVTELVYGVASEDFALEIEGILGDNVSDQDKLNHIGQLAQSLKKKE